MLLQDFISASLVEQPVDVFDFARTFFSTGPSAPTPLALGDDAGETGEPAPAGSDQGEQINDMDQDDLDGAPAPRRLEPGGRHAARRLRRVKASLRGRMARRQAGAALALTLPVMRPADVDAMAAAVDDELSAYLKSVFESMDDDSSGTISQVELRSKLQTDDQVQTLVGAAGGSEWSVLAQLDADGDGEITWIEFEQMIVGQMSAM